MSHPSTNSVRDHRPQLDTFYPRVQKPWNREDTCEGTTPSYWAWSGRLGRLFRTSRFMLTLTTCVPTAPSAIILPSLSSTSSHPDIVCVNGPNITLLELIVSGNSKEVMRQARERKQQKRPYLEITNDLHRQGLNAEYDTIEMDALGHCIEDTPFHLSHTSPKWTDCNGEASWTTQERLRLPAPDWFS